MTPQQARTLLEPHGGRLLHAFWRAWPGPRIWYGKYHAASRELFAALRAALREVGSSEACLERASIDEAFIDVSAAVATLADPLEAATAIAHRLLEALASSALQLRMSVGVAPNKLLAKLASTRAKLMPHATIATAAAKRGDEDNAEMTGTMRAAAVGRVFSVRDDEDVAALLHSTKASKLPGLGAKAEALERAGWATAADLQAILPSSSSLASCPHPPSLGSHLLPSLGFIDDSQACRPVELQQRLGLSAAQAQASWERCRGEDATPVREAVPQSCTVTSWLAHDLFTRLAVREVVPDSTELQQRGSDVLGSGCGGGGGGGGGGDDDASGSANACGDGSSCHSAALAVGSGAGWRFEPHAAKGKSNESRARWVLLALCLDLEEKLCHHVLTCATHALTSEALCTP